MLVEVFVSSLRSSSCICVASTFLKGAGMEVSFSVFMHVRIYIFSELVWEGIISWEVN